MHPTSISKALLRMADALDRSKRPSRARISSDLRTVLGTLGNHTVTIDMRMCDVDDHDAQRLCSGLNKLGFSCSADGDIVSFNCANRVECVKIPETLKDLCIKSTCSPDVRDILSRVDWDKCSVKYR